MNEQIASTASAIFEQSLPGIQAGDVSDLVTRCTEDVIFEFPFAPADRPHCVVGRAAVTEYLGPIFAGAGVQRLGSVVVHQTVDPAVAVIEFTTVTGAEGAGRELSYVVVLTVRDGQIARYRDYWNPLASAGEPSQS